DPGSDHRYRFGDSLYQGAQPSSYRQGRRFLDLLWKNMDQSVSTRDLEHQQTQQEFDRWPNEQRALEIQPAHQGYFHERASQHCLFCHCHSSRVRVLCF
ncbi:hypothetical protein MXB_699, partial [Myxobolus squamalis]